MARETAIEKGKEVEKMKLHMTAAILFAAALLGAIGMHSSKAETKGTVIVALGDSLTAGYGLEQSQAFPVQLERALKAKGQDVTIVNAGVSGDTAAAGLKRLDWALPKDADAVIIELGGNDALQGLPPEQIKASLERIITQVQAKGLPILLAGMEAPRNMGKPYTDAFRAVFADLAQRYDLVFYPFFLDGAAMTDGMMQGDGIHANDKGVAAIVKGILPKVEELLARVKAKG